MTMTHLSEDQVDALREIMNIAMGRAGASLARLLDRFIDLPVPKVRFIDAPLVLTAVRQIVNGDDQITAVRQAFTSVASGECLVLFGSASTHDLAELVGHDESEDAASEDEVLLDVANLLVGACVTGIGEQLGQDVSYSPPSLIFVRGNVDRLLDPETVPWGRALLLDVNFRIEGKTFVVHVLIFWPESAIMTVRERLDAFLEGV